MLVHNNNKSNALIAVIITNLNNIMYLQNFELHTIYNLTQFSLFCDKFHGIHIGNQH